MSKFSNLLKLIILLKSKKRMKTKEIAETLGVGERMVRKYISDLIEANVQVDSIPGPNGGYGLSGYDYLLNLDIKREEATALQTVTNKIKSEDVNIYNHLFNLNNKVQAIYESREDDNKYSISSIMQQNVVDLKRQTENEIELEASIIRRNKVKVNYYSVSSGYTTRVLQPYGIITRNNNKYLIAYCEKRKQILTFKLVRISKIEILDEMFEIPESFDINSYLNNHLGIFNDETLNLKLLIRKPFSKSVSEAIYADNQKITWNEDESIIFEAKMSGKTDIIRWIISMRTAVTVIEPRELKEEIRDELIKMLATI